VVGCVERTFEKKLVRSDGEHIMHRSRHNFFTDVSTIARWGDDEVHASIASSHIG
jgi:hypothetical protein